MSLFNSGGFLPHIISRPILVDILLRLVPANKISYSKKILQVKQEDDHVIIKCSDNSGYQSNILVGADGAYSSVRQNLYKALNAKGKLPKADNADLPFNSVCLVGQTAPLDPEVFPHLKDSHTWFETMVSQDKPYAVRLHLFSTFPVFCYLLKSTMIGAPNIEEGNGKCTPMDLCGQTNRIHSLA